MTATFSPETPEPVPAPSYITEFLYREFPPPSGYHLPCLNPGLNRGDTGGMAWLDDTADDRLEPLSSCPKSA
ncbi:hypothetical protein, partial [Azospirillum sp. B506]|uniref:hypothetical protein n=1 Tax=Azospirillum sp. B506 TaxID=137721 RepID=UPI001B3B9AFD